MAKGPVNGGEIAFFGAGLLYFLPEFVLIWKGSGQIKPNLFHASQQVAGAGKKLFVAGKELLVKGQKHGHALFGVELFAPDGSGQEGVGQQAAADHPALGRGELLAQAVPAFHVGDIAIINKGMAAQGEALPEAFGIGGAPIELLAQPGMDDDLGERIVVEPGQKLCQFIGMVQAQPGFDGELQGQAGENDIEKVANGVGVGQKAGAAPFAGDHGGWTAKVPVDLGVSQIMEPLPQGEQAVGVGVEKLRHHRQCPVLFRQQIMELAEINVCVRLRIQKGGDGLINTAEMVLEEGAKQAVGDSANGRKIQKRGLSHGHLFLQVREWPWRCGFQGW
ncbi:MAG: hypothetical protein FD168_542 [Desulfobulbaceae bacterium]|nr:MAG: hypothetical protein FD168_542 [Desulfobulbaceae bacterium]